MFIGDVAVNKYLQHLEGKKPLPLFNIKAEGMICRVINVPNNLDWQQCELERQTVGTEGAGRYSGFGGTSLQNLLATITEIESNGTALQRNRSPKLRTLC